MKEEFFLKLLIDIIVKKSDWGEAGDWANHHFQALGEDIRKVTGLQVSESTLKRMFGKKKTSGRLYNPHVYTKDILAQYAGYQSWNDFKKSETGKGHKAPAQSVKKTKFPYRRLYLPLGLLAVVVAALIFLLSPSANPLKSFSCENPSGYLPYTAIFHYKLEKTKDTVYIDFGNGETFYLAPERNMITIFCRSADYSLVRVYNRKKDLATYRLHVKSGFWQGGFSLSDSTSTFRPFEDQQVFRSKGILYTHPEYYEIMPLNKPAGYYTEYRYFDSFNAAADSIHFTAFIKNRASEGGRLCYDSEVILRAEYGDLLVRFLEPGCFRYARFQVSEKSYTGRFNDLSELGQNVQEWSKIDIQTTGNTAKVFFNDKPVLNENYTRALGSLKGVMIRFFGTGSVDSVYLASPDTVMISDGF